MRINSYSTVTELPNSGATQEQLSMLYTRYRLARDLAEEKDVLEVACGSGFGLGFLARKARRVVGGDYDHELVNRAKSHYGQKIEILQLEASYLPFDGGSFDVVLLLEAIYYLSKPEVFLAEARRVLKPGGILLICSANREWQAFNRSPFSFTYYSAQELKHIMGKAGFNVEIFAGYPVIVSGMRHDFLNLIRKVAVRFNLIPKTMRGKELLKRLFYGRLIPIPTEVTEDLAPFCSPVSVEGRETVPDYKVLYAIGRLPV